MKTLALISMKETKIEDDRSSDHFVDASDNFPRSDLIDEPDSEESVRLLQSSRLNSFGSRCDEVNGAALSSIVHHRSSMRFNRWKISNADAYDSSFGEISHLSDAVSPKERRNITLSALKDRGKVRERSDSLRFRPSSDIILHKKDRNYEKSVTADSNLGHLDGYLLNFLVWVAGMIIKTIGFQIGLFISFITFPFWVMHCSYKIVTHPFQTVRRARDRLFEKFFRICGILLATVSPSLHQWLQGSLSFRKIAVTICWGCLWLLYICCVLFGVLVSAFIVSWIGMRWFVEEPVRMKEGLNFDYTKANPVAFVPIMSCHGVDCGLLGCGEKVEVGKRIIHPNHQLQVTISLVLPESDHNRKLGVFQVKVEFLSANGNVSSASRHPCMLRFKSLPIRYMETFLKSPALLVGYSSESQLLNIKMIRIMEGNEPTSCLRVILEQRAEFKPGAGIPEIYAASLALESELPLLKRIIWKWRKTVFIWTSMWFFMMELFFILVCCRPVIFPRAKPKGKVLVREYSI